MFAVAIALTPEDTAQYGWDIIKSIIYDHNCYDNMDKNEE